MDFNTPYICIAFLESIPSILCYIILAIIILTLFACIPTTVFPKFRLSYLSINWHFLHVYVTHDHFKATTNKELSPCSTLIQLSMVFHTNAILVRSPLFFIIKIYAWSYLFFVYICLDCPFYPSVIINIQSFIGKKSACCLLSLYRFDIDPLSYT